MIDKERICRMETFTEIRVNAPEMLDGPRNFRELGGYPAKDGVIKKGILFRSDGLQSLSGRDRQWMKEQDITCVIDLRSENEAEKKPDALEDGFEYHHIPMSDKMGEKDGKEIYPDSLSELYRLILDRQMEGFARVMRIMLERDGRPQVFHCAVGKDRTGMTAMLILWLCGVPDEVIAADYAVSERNMKPVFDRLRETFEEAHMDVPDILFGSPAEEMTKTMGYVRERWGSAAGYLRACGLSDAELERLCELFVEKA